MVNRRAVSTGGAMTCRKIRFVLLLQSQLVFRLKYVFLLGKIFLISCLYLLLHISYKTPHVDMINDVARVFVCHFCVSLRFINFHGFINKATINVVPLSGTLINAGATQFFWLPIIRNQHLLRNELMCGRHYS